MILDQLTALHSDTRDNFALKEAIRYQIARFRKADDKGYGYDAAVECIDAIEALVGAMKFEAIENEH